MRGEIFFESFLEGIGFQWDGDGVFIQAEAIGAGQRIGADASVRERDEGEGRECPGKGRRGARWHRGDVKKGGGRFFMVAAVLFVLRCANETATFLHIRDNKKMGLMGLMGLIGSGKNAAGMHGGNGWGDWGGADAPCTVAFGLQ